MLLALYASVELQGERPAQFVQATLHPRSCFTVHRAMFPHRRKFTLQCKRPNGKSGDNDKPENRAHSSVLRGAMAELSSRHHSTRSQPEKQLTDDTRPLVRRVLVQRICRNQVDRLVVR
jgi:hypothetical protein